jgi:hypothetical protein
MIVTDEMADQAICELRRRTRMMFSRDVMKGVLEAALEVAEPKAEAWTAEKDALLRVVSEQVLTGYMHTFPKLHELYLAAYPAPEPQKPEGECP